MLEKRFFVLLLVASVLSGLSQADITNIDFTQGTDPYGLSGWNPAGAVSVVEYETGDNYVWFRENQSGDFTSSIWQSFEVPDGAQYFSFNVDLYSSDAPTTDTFTVTLAGEEILAINNHNAPLNQTVQVPISSLLFGQSVLLEFVLLSDPTNGGSTEAFIGNLDLSISSIPIVPVPSAMLLGGLGVASVNWLRKRRIL